MPLRLGMLGMWHTHAKGIVEQVAVHPDEFQLVGFFDEDPEVARRQKAAWTPIIGPMTIVSSPSELLGLKLDGVVVEGPVYRNVALARHALDAGFPVMLEKPAGDKWDDFKSLVDLAQRKHLPLQMIYLFRYMSAVQEMLKRGEKGDFGQIYHFRGRLPKDLETYDRFVEELDRYPGGIFFEMAGHLVDMMVRLLGKPKKITSFLAHHYTQKPGKFVDNGVAVFEFERAYATIEVPAMETVPFARRIEVFGTGGSCVIPHLGSGHLGNKSVQGFEFCSADAKDWTRLELPAATLQIADLREFAACVRREKTPSFSHEHDLIAQEALLKASGMW